MTRQKLPPEHYEPNAREQNNESTCSQGKNRQFRFNRDCKRVCKRF